MGAGLGLFARLLACPLVQVCGLALAILLTLAKMERIPSFLSALSLYVWCVACKYAPISRFKGVFRGFYMVCVGLFVLRALRGLCGFCARVELGG